MREDKIIIPDLFWIEHRYRYGEKVELTLIGKNSRGNRKTIELTVSWDYLIERTAEISADVIKEKQAELDRLKKTLREAV